MLFWNSQNSDKNKDGAIDDYDKAECSPYTCTTTLFNCDDRLKQHKA